MEPSVTLHLVGYLLLMLLVPMFGQPLQITCCNIFFILLGVTEMFSDLFVLINFIWLRFEQTVLLDTTLHLQITVDFIFYITEV